LRGRGHVGLDDPPARPAAAQGGEVDAVHLREPAGDGRGARGARLRRAAVALRGGRLRGGRLLVRHARGLAQPLGPVGMDGRPRGAVQHGDRVPHGHARAHRSDDLQHPGGFGGVAHRRLVGLDLDELVPDGDLVAVGPQPRQDRPSSIDSDRAGMVISVTR
jgi:hypothetical protein